jgi:NodT family efflux transporter outer membrane factor (OMF) lipoprotein
MRQMKVNHKIHEDELMAFFRIKNLSLLAAMLLCGCMVGPDYKRPAVQAPVKLKEAPKGWKYAKPGDVSDRGKWWKIFNDPQLSALEDQLNISNMTIQNAAENYQQSVALVSEARAAYFPTVASSLSLTRQKQGSSGSATFNSTSIQNTSSTTDGTSTPTTSTSSGSIGSSSSNPSTFHSLVLDASWEPDIWGSARRTVEGQYAGAQSSAALLAATRLSAQASLAEFYFELIGVDRDQQLLDDTVKSDKAIFTFTQNQYKAGVANYSAMVQARGQLETAQGLSINNGVNRALYEHAIAVLIGVPPESFSIKRTNRVLVPPRIPLEVPAELLERRPDIAEEERLMQQANAQIGVAVAAYYPTLSLSATGNVTNPNFTNFFSLPALSWSLASQLADTIYDGGLRNATVVAAKAGYKAALANYKQTVLAAFQDVEDNLASLSTLEKQTAVDNKAAKDAALALKLVVNEYKAGTIDYSSVLTTQITTYTAEKTAVDTNYLSMSSAVGLIKALGGGWDAKVLDNALD